MKTIAKIDDVHFRFPAAPRLRLPLQSQHIGGCEKNVIFNRQLVFLKLEGTRARKHFQHCKSKNPSSDYCRKKYADSSPCWHGLEQRTALRAEANCRRPTGISIAPSRISKILSLQS